MSDSAASFERYLQGEPLNEELAAVRDGKPDAGPDAVAAAEKPEIRHPERELRRGERQDLKEVVRTEGWKVVLRIQEKLSQNLEKSAISMSQINPLQNSAAIGEAWAYSLMFDRAMSTLNQAIEAELAEHEKAGGVE